MTAILVVDDSPVCRRVTAAALSHRYTVDAVNDGMQAVKAVRSKKYVAIVMDIDMPELDGIEATRLIRMWEKLGGDNAVIVAYSASAADRTGECFQAGMDACVRKPLSPAELVEKLGLIISMKDREGSSSKRWTGTYA